MQWDEGFEGRVEGVVRFLSSDFPCNRDTCWAFDTVNETALQIFRMRVIALRWAFVSPPCKQHRKPWLSSSALYTFCCSNVGVQNTTNSSRFSHYN